MPSSPTSTLAPTSPVTSSTASTRCRHQQCALVRCTGCTASPCSWPYLALIVCSQGQNLDVLTAPRADEIIYHRCIRGQNEGGRIRVRARVTSMTPPEPLINYTACEGVYNPLQHTTVIAETIQTNTRQYLMPRCDSTLWPWSFLKVVYSGVHHCWRWVHCRRLKQKTHTGGTKNVDLALS